MSERWGGSALFWFFVSARGVGRDGGAAGRRWTPRSGLCRVHHVSSPSRDYFYEVGWGGSALGWLFVFAGGVGRDGWRGQVLGYAGRALPSSSCVCAREELSDVCG